MWIIFLSLLITPARYTDAAFSFCESARDSTPCSGANIEECTNNGCCWNSNQMPKCFFQTPKYYVKERSNTTNGVKMTIAVSDESGSGKFPGSPISPLQVDIIEETNDRLHIKITDPNDQRWEIPDSLLPLPPPPYKPLSNTNYQLQIPDVDGEFFFAIYRRTEYLNVTIFNTSSIDFLYANQLLQIGTDLAPNSHIYGLGEHKTSLLLNNQKRTLTLWNYDGGTPDDLNLYGSHPFYMGLEQGGSAHGVFLRNSNGMDIDIAQNYLKYNVIGGVLDFYFFMGPSPDEVLFQYYDVIGRPAMPPYWALGFHQCRHGYKNLEEVKNVVQNYAKYEIPLDTMWTDIDYMDGFKDFTTDPTNFPTVAMKNFVEELHQNGQHYVVIIDPGISKTVGYKAYDDGVSMDIFIKDRNNDIFTGMVWPGYTAFPDFEYPLATEYWTNQIASFIDEVPIDGLWIDMNEPSSRCNGSCTNTTDKKGITSVRQNFNPTNPPYNIGNRRAPGDTKAAPLNMKTFDMDAKHHSGALAYNTHNMYGFTESMATRQALLTVKEGKRPFVLSRSTFAGSGSHAAHWLGDNKATAEDLHLSISTILSFQMFGVTLVGADICGFGGNTTEELCARWMELGSFYPFSRNHNTIKATSQEPYLWPSVAAISRKYLGLRYSLLPYYYTLFYKISYKGSGYAAVLRPLFHDYMDETSIAMDTEFLVGGELLVAPQLSLGDEGKDLDVFLPKNIWYDWYTHEQVSDGLEPKPLPKVPTPLDHVPLYVRAGAIIPMQEPGLTTTESRKNSYSLLVVLKSGYATGELYLDDGETYNTSEYSYISYSCEETQMTASVTGTNFATKAGLPMLHNITFLGLLSRPSVVALDGVPKNFTFIDGYTLKMIITDLFINMDREFVLNWQ